MPLLGSGFDRTPPRSGETNNRLAGAIIGCGLFILLGLSGLVWGLTEQPRENQEYQQFQSDPVCANTGYPTTSCRVDAPMTVVDRWSETHISRHNSHCDWYIELRTDTGAEYTAAYETYNTGFGLPHFDPPLVYQVATLGATLNAEAWHDQVMWISVGRSKYDTVDHPTKNGGYAFIGLCLVWTVLWTLGLIAGIRNILCNG